jgi:hypothetical protein
MVSIGATTLNAQYASTNWSGYVIPAGPGAFTAITGCWQVPTVSSTPGNTYSSTWIGIDGFVNNDPDLIQTGTDQVWYQGSAQYSAWWEILPGPPATETQITSLTITPGDAMCASIVKGSGTNWTIRLSDTTTGKSFNTVQSYSAPQTSAEWIVEAPTVGGVQANLANYGQVTFDGTVNGTDPGLDYNDGIAMVQQSSPVSTPSNPNAAGDGFTLEYGASQPVPPPSPGSPTITSVSPKSGPSSGGQSVTISGSGFEMGAVGATVSFNGIPATGVTVTSSSQLSAVTPSEVLAGVSINPLSAQATVTVTNPDGGSTSNTSAYTVDWAGGYTLNAFGDIAPFGDSPLVTATGYFNFKIAKALVLDPCDSSGDISGWVLDGYGGLHPFADMSTPMPATPTISAYWPGWDIANAVATFCVTVTVGGAPQPHAEGCVLDGYGGLHPWADSSAVPLPACNDSGYWPGQDIATKITVIPGTDEGYVMDVYGGVHPCNGAPYDSVSAYWPGWNIARGIVATANGGYVVDAYGGIHPFGNAPWFPVAAYWPGWDIVRGIAVAYGGAGIYTLDGYGGVHPAGGAPYLAVSALGYWPGVNFVRDIVTAP